MLFLDSAPVIKGITEPLVFIQRPFTLSVSFGFHSPPLLTFKSDWLDFRGLDARKSDIKGSLT